MSITNEVAKKVMENEERVKVFIEDLLTSAFEGGSNYWYTIEEHNLDEINEPIFLSGLLSLEGSKMLISDVENTLGEGKWVHHVDVLKAWNTFSKCDKYRRHYEDVLDGNDDATTGDVFLQLVVFGKVIYG